jgi:hypothetical protein
MAAHSALSAHASILILSLSRTAAWGETRDGIDAIEKVRQLLTDLVLMNIYML